MKHLCVRPFFYFNIQSFLTIIKRYCESYGKIVQSRYLNTASNICTGSGYIAGCCRREITQISYNICTCYKKKNIYDK